MTVMYWIYGKHENSNGDYDNLNYPTAVIRNSYSKCKSKVPMLQTVHVGNKTVLSKVTWLRRKGDPVNSNPYVLYLK